MGYLFAKKHAAALQSFAASNVLLAFDYDGTLAPIHATPARARMRQRTRRLLAAVARRYPCIVVSGRTHDELARHLDGIPIWHVAGNHGVEPWDKTTAFAEHVREWMRMLERRLKAVRGITIEDKTYSIAIHYRRARQKEVALAAIRRSLRRLRGSRVVNGRQAIDVVPRGAPDKGTTLVRARRQLVCDVAIYVGDDATDEDAFACEQPDRLLAIRVGAERGSRAAHHLRSQNRGGRAARRADRGKTGPPGRVPAFEGRGTDERRSCGGAAASEMTSRRRPPPFEEPDDARRFEEVAPPGQPDRAAAARQPADAVDRAAISSKVSCARSHPKRSVMGR